MTMLPAERKIEPADAAPGKIDDYSGTFHTLRAKLVDSKGRRYSHLVRALRPNYARVYRDIALGYGMLIISGLLTVWLSLVGSPPVLTVVAGALLIAIGSPTFNSSSTKARISILRRAERQTSASATA